MIITDLVNDPAGCQRETDSQGRHWGPYTNINGEYVEIANNSTLPHSISGWRVRDQDGHTYVFPLCDQLAPGAHVRLHTGIGTNSAAAFYWNRKAPVWNNSGDKASLVDTSGEVVSEFATRLGSATLSGHVYVVGTLNGIAGAEIVYVGESGKGSGVADSGGAYSMPVDIGRHRLKASLLNYGDSAVFSAMFGPNEAVNHDFELNPSGSSGSSVISIGVVFTPPSGAAWNSSIRVPAQFQNNGVAITSFVASLEERPAGGADADWVKVDDVDLPLTHQSGDTWAYTFTVPAKTWGWHHGSGVFVVVDDTERAYEYRVVCIGERQSLSTTRYSDVRGVPVRVGDSKVDSAQTQNVSMVVTLAAFAFAVAALIPVIVSTLPVAAAFASSTWKAIAGCFAALGTGAGAVKTGASYTMNDPISLSGLYSKVVRPVVSQITTRSQDATRIAGVALFNSASTVAGCSQAALECRDRLATANLYGTRSLIAKQERKLQEFKDRITASADQLDLLRDQVLAGFGADFGLTTGQFAQVRSYLAANPVPPALVTQLTSAGLSAAQIEEYRQAILHANPTADELNLVGGLTSMVSSVRRDVGHLFAELERITF